MSNKFTVTEAHVRERDGESYYLGNYKEGEDYVFRKCFKSYKRMFRSDILGATNEQSLAVEEPKQVSEEATEQLEEQPEVSVATRNVAQECKITRLYPNQRWVETDKGRVFVGLKGNKLRVNQVISVLNGELSTKLNGRKPSMVRI